ncbi:hypothetical protein SLE2022_377700 [Rubroshorea leprosula]
MYSNNHRFVPCLHCNPHSYIRMVQYLIERCLLLRMNMEQCVKALAEHASIRPRITLAVLKELQKENRDFFQAYFLAISPRPFIMTGRHIQRTSRLTRKKQYWK